MTIILSVCLTSADAIGVGEIDIGFVDQQRAGESIGQLEDSLGRNHRARRAVGVGQKREFQSRGGLGEIVGQRPIVLKVDLLGFGALKLGEGFVEDVAGVGEPEAVALADEGASDDRQDVVAAVAAENPVGFDAEKFGGALAEGGGQRIGVFLQASLDGAAEMRCRRPARTGRDSRWY